MMSGANDEAEMTDETEHIDEEEHVDRGYFDTEYEYNDEDAEYELEEEEPVPTASTQSLPSPIGRQIDNPDNPFRLPHHTTEYDVYMEHLRRIGLAPDTEVEDEQDQ